MALVERAPQKEEKGRFLCSVATGDRAGREAGRTSGQDRRQLRASPVALAKPGPEASKTWGGKGQVSLGQGSVCVIDLCAESLLRPSWLASPSSVLTWKTPSPATGLRPPALLPLGSRPPQDTAS